VVEADSVCSNFPCANWFFGKKVFSVEKTQQVVPTAHTGEQPAPADLVRMNHRTGIHSKSALIDDNPARRAIRAQRIEGQKRRAMLVVKVKWDEQRWEGCSRSLMIAARTISVG